MKCVFFVRKKIFSRIRVRKFDTMQRVNRFSTGGIFCFIVSFAGFADELLCVRGGEAFVPEQPPAV